MKYKIENDYLFIIDNNVIVSKIRYEITDCVYLFTKEVEDSYLFSSANRLIAILYYLEKDFIFDDDRIINAFKLANNILKHNCITIRRFMKVGFLDTGVSNSICDVPGVRVGNYTLHDECNHHTGVTIVSPHDGNMFREKVVGASYVFNGFGKSTGFIQIDELGTIETDIALTTTLNAGKICDAMISHALDINKDIAVTTGTINQVVLECNDGDLNKSRDRVLGTFEVEKCYDILSNTFKQGSVGAGSGMICHGLKGGIGSSSRKLLIDGNEYTIGVLVNSNFGDDDHKALIFNNHYIGDKFTSINDLCCEEKGSIVVVVATDLPVSDRQLKRIIKRCEIGIGRTGSYAGNGSGDVFVGFSTANKVSHYNNQVTEKIERFNENYISLAFKAVVEATEEAVLNSMLFSKPIKGFIKDVNSICEYPNAFINLLDEDIIIK